MLTILVLAIWIYNNREFLILGLELTLSWTALTGLGLALLGTGYLVYLFNIATKDEGQLNSIRTKLNDYSSNIYLPRSKQDYKWFVIVSVSAGICEEILFRGYLIWYINEFSSMTVAIILSSVVFGLAHTYQGWKGILQSAGIGLVLALIYAFTNTLWIPIVLHMIIDAYSGMLGWLAFDEWE